MLPWKVGSLNVKTEDGVVHDWMRFSYHLRGGPCTALLIAGSIFYKFCWTWRYCLVLYVNVLTSFSGTLSLHFTFTMSLEISWRFYLIDIVQLWSTKVDFHLVKVDIFLLCYCWFRVFSVMQTGLDAVVCVGSGKVF